MNKEIIKSLPLLRLNSKNMEARNAYLDQKENELIKINGIIKNSRLRASDICLQVLEGHNPGISKKGILLESDWGTKKLLYKSVVSRPQRRNEKAKYIWDEVLVEAKRISDKRGVDNKIELFNKKNARNH